MNNNWKLLVGHFMKKSKDLKGKINSIETMGLVDGPGIRFVVFLQGCPLRCSYCHNPETWNLNSYNIELTPYELVEKIIRYKNYFGEDGGVTFSGGEPLFQKDFLLECLKLCKKQKINTAIDTAGSVEDYDEILDYVDLVIFDIKSYKDDQYKNITNKSIKNSLKFLFSCQQKQKKMWLRTVIVPGINDSEEFIYGLKNFIKDLKNIEKVELLPYQTLGVEKYKKLKIPYKLDKTPIMDNKKCNKLQQLLSKR